MNGLKACAAGRESAELKLTEECIASFLEELARKGRTPGTLDTYQRNICSLYDALPEDKTLLPGMLDRWQQDMLAEGYSPRTVNTRLSVANHLVAFLGRRELQTRGTLQIGEGGTPELTRREYLRLQSDHLYHPQLGLCGGHHHCGRRSLCEQRPRDAGGLG